MCCFCFAQHSCQHVDEPRTPLESDWQKSGRACWATVLAALPVLLASLSSSFDDEVLLHSKYQKSHIFLV